MNHRQFSRVEIEKFLDKTYKCFRMQTKKSMYQAGNLVFIRRFPRDPVPSETVYRIGMIRDVKSDPESDWGGVYGVELFERVQSDGNDNVFQPAKVCVKLQRVLQRDVVGYVLFPVKLLNRHISFETGTIPEVAIN